MRARLSKFLAEATGIFVPPFDGLPVAMWCYFVFSTMALPHNPVWRGDLPDPDDYTYLTQTLDWLQGQGWFDNIQHRMMPPDGVAIHYTRFAELPMAALIMLFRLFHYSWHGAALLASFILPVAYLGALFAALRWAAAQLISPRWARLTAFIALFATVLTFKFAPGQVDHHGLEAILIIGAFGLAAQMFAKPHQMRWAVGCGFVLALATAIALEVLPWMTLISAAIGIWAVIEGRKAARSAMVFGVSLFTSSAVLLLLDKSAAEILHPDLLSYSIAYVALAAGIAKALLVAAGSSWLKNVRLRVAVGGGVALALGALYLWYFPALLAGPYGAMDTRLAQLFFANLEEAVAMVKNYSVYKSLLLIATPLLGLGASLFFLHTAKDAKKWGWALSAALLTAAILFALFYQIRMLIYAQLFALIPLAGFAERGWAWIDTHYEGRRRFWAEIVLVLLLGPLTGVLLPALQDGRSFNSGVLLFPAQTFDDSCEMAGLEKLLNAPHYAARAPLRIVNLIDQGPELLFRTPHAVLSAPYHTNVRGNLEALDFFSTLDPADAEKIARKDGVNLVVLCRDIPDMYLAGDGAHYVFAPNGEERMLANPSFAGQLAFHKPPAWLTEIPVPSPSNYLLFEVKQ